MSIVIRTFRVGAALYRHVIFTTDDDRVECQDADGNTILIYTAKCQIRDKTGAIGNFYVENDRWTSYHGPTRERRVYGDVDAIEGLLDAEVEFSKSYIENMNKEVCSESEAEEGA